VKLFTPDGQWTWYGIEFDGKDIFFGYVKGFEAELGYFSLKELEGVRGHLGLPVERDKWFKPTKLSEVKKLEGYLEQEAKLKFDPLLVAIGCQIGVGCMANSRKSTSKLPVCSVEEKTKRDSCIIAVKTKLPAGCNAKEWNKPPSERRGNCVNPFSVCTSAVSCRSGGKSSR
jgi:hypothetical protein